MLPVTSSSNSRRSKRKDFSKFERRRIGRGVESSGPESCHEVTNASRASSASTVILERERRLTADDTAVALEQFHADDTGHALLHVVDVGVERLAQRREPEAVVDGVGVLQADSARESIALPRHHHLLQLLVRLMQDDGRRRFVDLPRLAADQPVLDHVDAADAVRTRDRAQTGNQFQHRTSRRR